MELKSKKQIKEYLTNQIDYFSQLFKNIIKYDCKFYNEYDLLLLSVCKRSVDILDTINYSVRKNNINSLYPLIRLQIDNCLILQASLICKNNKKFFNKLNDSGFQFKNFKFPNTNDTITERKLAKIISENKPNFIYDYDYCCDFVHFTKQTLNLPICNVKDLTFYMRCEVGNSDNKLRIYIGIDKLKNINSTLLDLIEICRKEFATCKEW